MPHYIIGSNEQHKAAVVAAHLWVLLWVHSWAATLQHSTTIMDMQMFVLDNNRLSTLPTNIGPLQHLAKLSVSNNAVTSLPTSTKQLHHLRVLDVSSNRLAILPDAVAGCQSLEEFNVSNNLVQVCLMLFTLTHAIYNMLYAECTHVSCSSSWLLTWLGG